MNKSSNYIRFERAMSALETANNLFDEICESEEQGPLGSTVDIRSMERLQEKFDRLKRLMGILD